jgi:hypothetical protein
MLLSEKGADGALTAPARQGIRCEPGRYASREIGPTRDCLILTRKFDSEKPMAGR